MSVDWGYFLSALEQHVRANPWETIPGAEGPKGAWLASPPATDSHLGELASRLGAPLPPSYASFLRACNGLGMASHPIHAFLAASEVNWFRKRHSDWIRAYTAPQDPSAERDPPDEEYYGYADDVRPWFRPKHFRHTVRITEVGDSAVYLLNPQVVWPSGEWEAWFLANWNPGVIRYRSFAELMWEQYGPQAGLNESRFGLVRDGGLPTVYEDPPGKPARRTKKVRVLPPPRSIEAIARDVRDGDLPRLRKALNELARLRTPPAIELLVGVLRDHPVDVVREEAALALGKSRHADAVPALVAALRDEYSTTVNMVINALAGTRDPRAVEPLLRLLEKRPTFLVETLAMALAKFNEPRAAQILGKIMRDGASGDHRGADNASALLFQFGDAGLPVLLDAMENGSIQAKLRAVRGACYYPMAQVEPALRKLTADADASVRDAAAQVLQILPGIEGAKRR